MTRMTYLALVLAAARAAVSAVAAEQVGGTGGWPVVISSGVPKWEGGRVEYAAGNASEYIVILSSNQEGYGRYLAALRDAGFVIAERGKGIRADKPGLRVDLLPRGEDRYQLTVYSIATGTWPDSGLPPFLQPLAGKPLVGEPDLNADSDNYANISFVYGDVTVDEAREYLRGLASRLDDGTYADRSGPEGFAILWGTFFWNGKQWKAIGEASEDAPGSCRFDIGWTEVE